jgi:hypothetical protein
MHEEANAVACPEQVAEEDIPFYANFAVVGISSCRSETDRPCKSNNGSLRAGQSTSRPGRST